MTVTAYYPPAYNSTYCKATAEYSGSYVAHMAFNPALSLTGSFANNQWLMNYAVTSRLHCDLGESRVVNSLLLHNSHSSGTNTTDGCKLVELWGTDSATEFANVSGGLIVDGTLIKRFLVAEHVATDTADPQTFTLNNDTGYRYYVLLFLTYYGGAHLGVRRATFQYDDTISYDAGIPEVPEGWDVNLKNAALCTNQSLESIYRICYRYWFRGVLIFISCSIRVRHDTCL